MTAIIAILALIGCIAVVAGLAYAIARYDERHNEGGSTSSTSYRSWMS